MLIPTDFAAICRVCLKRNPTYSIFDNHIKLEQTNASAIACDIRSKIMVCSKVDIFEGDKLPEKICEACTDSLEIAYNFKILCEETDTTLHTILKEYSSVTDRGSNEESVPCNELKVEPKEETLEPGLDIEMSDFGEVDCAGVVFVSKKRRKVIRNGVRTRKKRIKRYDCECCEQTFTTRAFLSKHVKMLHGFERRAIKCYRCDKEFSDTWLRDQHEQDCVECTEYKCDDCHVNFSDRITYEGHIKKHLKSEDKHDSLFQCDACKKVFKTRSNLVQHSHIHKTKREHVCEICGRAFNRRDYLLTHIPTHTGVKKHRCPHCDFRSAQKSSLNVHLRVHTGERPYTCDTCGQKCINSSNLLAHKRRHEGVKKFKCKLCEKLFAYKASLEEHVSSTHAGLKEHICHFCGAAYSRKRGLQRHTRQKHPNNVIAAANGTVEQTDDEDR